MVARSGGNARFFYGTIDPTVIRQAQENLREDLARAVPLRAPLEIAPNQLADLAFKLFYDQM